MLSIAAWKKKEGEKMGKVPLPVAFMSAFVDGWKRERQLFPTGNVLTMTVSKQLKLSRPLWHLPCPAVPPLLYLGHIQTPTGLRPALRLPFLKPTMKLTEKYWLVAGGLHFVAHR